MKSALLSLIIFFVPIFLSAQITFENGPELNNDKDWKVNRLLEGDDGTFYTYRVRTKGPGTSFYIEKYSKDGMSLVFSKEVEMESSYNEVMNVLYSQGRVFLFLGNFDQYQTKMTLTYLTVSSAGEVQKKEKEILMIKVDHRNQIDIGIIQNPGKTEFLVKACFRGEKLDDWKTDLVLFNSTDMSQIWRKGVNQRMMNLNAITRNNILSNNWSTPAGKTGVSSARGGSFKMDPEREDIGLVGIFLDDEENVFYGISTNGTETADGERKYQLILYTLDKTADKPKSLDLGFPEKYIMSDVLMSKTNREMIIGGMFKESNSMGSTQVNSGVLAYKVNIDSNKVVSNTIQLFDASLLKAIGSIDEDNTLRYKMDYIFHSGTDVYFVGEEFKETYSLKRHTSTTTQYNGSNGGAQSGGYGGAYAGSNNMHTGPGTTTTMHNSTVTAFWEYEYRDVIVCKWSQEGKFVWIKNAPMEVKLMLKAPHLLKQYFVMTANNQIYFLCNENPKNLKLYNAEKFDQDAMEATSGVMGSNFVYSSLSMDDGTFHHGLVFSNDEYGFAPNTEADVRFMPPPECENFVSGGINTAIIYTEHRGAGRFSKLSFK